MLGGYYDLFDAIYASNKMGVSKPHRDFYRYILMSEGVKPEDAVFIDDTEENVISADKLGIYSIWFKDSVRLRTDIERHLNQKNTG